MALQILFIESLIYIIQCAKLSKMFTLVRNIKFNKCITVYLLIDKLLPCNFFVAHFKIGYCT